jgi:hypothetical protein
VQKVQLFLEHLDDGTAQLPHEAVEEMFRRESAAAAAPPPAERAPQPAAPAAGTTPHPDRAYQPPAAPPPVVRPPAAQPLAEVPATEPAAAPSAPASRAPEFPRLRAPAADLDPVPSRPSRAARPEVVTKETPWRASSANLRVQTAPPARPDTPVVPPVAAAQPPVHREPEPAQEPPRRAVPNVKPTPRFAGAWLLATVSVGGLLVLVLTLQFLPPADAPGAAAWRGFEMPQVQFAPGDSLDTPEPRPTGPSVRSAAMPLPVESPVPTGEFPLDGSPADSATAIPDSLRTAADTIGVAHGR